MSDAMLTAVEPPSEPPVDLTRPLRPRPAPSLRPWAGTRLGEGVGEVWAAGPASIVTWPDGGTTSLDELAAAAGEDLVGSAGIDTLGRRFPLLAKLIDAAEWLSLQVHPDDALARRLYGPDAVGKDEAWLLLEGRPGARLVVGPAPGLAPEAVMTAVASGGLGLERLEVHDAVPGDVLDVPAGTIHAIGPGAFVYELEQPSDLTFRISDWGRPATTARPLHLDEACQAVIASQRARIVGSGWRLDGGALDARRLRLELVSGDSPTTRRPAGRSPEIVTAARGAVTLRGDGWTERLAALETAVLPAAVTTCDVVPDTGAVAAVGSLPR